MTEPSQYFKGRTVQEQMNEVIGYVDTRAAEVATAAIASDVAQVHQDMLDADADATAAAASAAAAAGTLANAVKKTGEASQSIAGDIAVAGDLTGGTVTVPAPVNNTDAASKKYVDDADALLVPISSINSYAVGLIGNQNPIAGNKIFTGMTQTKGLGYMEGTVSVAGNTWTRILTFTDGRHVVKLLGLNVNGFGVSDVCMFWPSGSQVNRSGAVSTAMMSTNLNMITIFNITNGVYELWAKQGNPNNIYIYSLYSDGDNITIDGVTTSASEPQEDNITYKQKVTLQ